MEKYLYLQRLLNHYWKRWKQEYLYQLTVRNKWQKETSPIQVGDIVMVSEDNNSRGRWPLARVEEVHPGKDGLVRTAIVIIQRSTLTRSVQRLHRLEIESAAPQASQKGFLYTVGGSYSRTLFPLRVLLFLNLNVVFSSPTEDKVGRMLQPVALVQGD